MDALLASAGGASACADAIVTHTTHGMSATDTPGGAGVYPADIEIT
jgi:hypothetical protein